jgi:hypothetical protein
MLKSILRLDPRSSMRPDHRAMFIAAAICLVVAGCSLIGFNPAPSPFPTAGPSEKAAACAYVLALEDGHAQLTAALADQQKGHDAEAASVARAVAAAVKGVNPARTYPEFAPAPLLEVMSKYDLVAAMEERIAVRLAPDLDPSATIRDDPATLQHSMDEVIKNAREVAGPLIKEAGFPCTLPVSQ